ncbi:melanoma antigen preferentially expressed in tumors-like [Echinops telfairi]|uniref:Melanoma antigen preferentially expressed in tumors-like n=1 Tax=Echinops telfairi TaxID=9371 RepID=A0ABM0J9F9_ECHTE|nr:melanoma antigen preferentially expressed in tumors-like [Echinops telfairi]
MSTRNLPRLLDLSIQCVLQNEASVIAALEWLPVDLFSPLFKAAFDGGHTEIVKSMVFSWPFTHLHLGTLVEGCESPYGVLKAVLDGLEMLLAHRVRPRRCKLRQLDLRRHTDTEIWNTWLVSQFSGFETASQEPEATPPSTQSPEEERSGSEERHQLLPPVNVIIDLRFREEILNALLTILGEMVKEGKTLPPLYCRKVEFVGDVPQVPVLEEILQKVRLDSVWDVEVDGRWDLHDLNWFAPYLSKMVNLHTISLSGITLCCLGSCRQDGVQMLLAEFTSHFVGLYEIEDLILESVLLHGRLHQLLTCFQAPLKSLTINACKLVDSDLTCLSCCRCTSHLQSLDLSGVPRVVAMEASAGRWTSLASCHAEPSSGPARIPQSHGEASGCGELMKRLVDTGDTLAACMGLSLRSQGPLALAGAPSGSPRSLQRPRNPAPARLLHSGGACEPPPGAAMGAEPLLAFR